MDLDFCAYVSDDCTPQQQHVILLPGVAAQVENAVRELTEGDDKDPS